MKQNATSQENDIMNSIFPACIHNVISISDFNSTLIGQGLTALMFTIDDCSACRVASELIDVECLSTYGWRYAEVRAAEMNPEHSEALRNLRVDIVPQLRFYVYGELVMAMAGIEENATKESMNGAIMSFIGKFDDFRTRRMSLATS